MQVSINPPPLPVEREVTLVMSESEAKLLRQICGSTSANKWQEVAADAIYEKWDHRKAYTLASNLYNTLRKVV